MKQEETKKIASLAGKIRIEGSLTIQTGLHIGGAKEALDIGALNLDVIKTSKGIPYIPGSSIKGKLRSLLAAEEGSPDVDQDSKEIKMLFGEAGDDEEKGIKGRMIFRDCFLEKEHFKKTFDPDRLQEEYSEHKTENRINRVSGTAEHPRTLARVPADARFHYEFIYDIMDEGENLDLFTQGQNQKLLDLFLKAMRLLEDDYLGGQGTRGYGQIHFIREDFAVYKKTIASYADPKGQWELLPQFTLQA